MKTSNEDMKVRILALAVKCALLATFVIPLSAYAEEDEVYALTHPTNTVDFGALYISQKSARFGQYNGLSDQGFYGLGGFDVRGGKGYDSKESGLRWKLNGSNLGTTSRALGASISDQGKWKLNLGYDELRHNITDTFQTPLQGETGGNNFTLPSAFGTATDTTNTRNLQPIQLNLFHTEKEYTTRRNGSLGTSYTFSDHLSAQIDYNHLQQSGAKLIGTGSQGGISLTGGSTGTREAVNIIMNPTSYSTDTINTALNWVGDKAHLTAGYFGSIFHDDYNSLSWQSGIVSGATGCVGTGCFVNNTMSTAPSNSLHQANLSGGYNFTPTTKLTGGFSYGYNTQNSSYAPTLIPQNNGTSFNMMQTNGLPVTSLNGVVQTTHGDLKITNQSIKDLTLNAGFKFNERDNQTDSNTYLYKNIGSTGVGTNGFYTGVNTPYSNRKVQYEASADYRLTKAQNLNLAYEHETVDRWCNKVVGGAQCVSSPNTEEDKIALTYRLKAIENINFNTGYSYANRRADFAHFLANTGSYGTGSSIDSGNVLGYIAYPFASRDQHLGKAGVNWQVTPKVDVGVNGRYSQDNYDVTYGLKNGKSASVNIDATYSYADNGSVSVYWSWQNSRRYLHRGANGSVTVPPTQIYNNKLDDNSHAVGLLAKQGGLLNGKLEITGDMSYSFDASAYSSQLFYTPTNGIPCNDPRALTCGDLTPIKNELISLKLTGNYKIHKNGKVALAYMYQKLNSNDYFYNGQQFGFTQSSLMPTGLQLQDYTVNAVALSYNLAF